MKLIKITFLSVIITLCLAACNHKPQQAATGAQGKDSLSSDSLAVADTTLYGVAGDFGMSTFCLITDKGDTLYVARDSEDGTDGKIYGEAQPGERYAMTTRDNGQSLGVAINLTQLEKHTKDYKIFNGQLILHPNATPDTVQINRLDDKNFDYQSVKAGKAEEKQAK